jgi:hypothetical protein
MIKIINIKYLRIKRVRTFFSGGVAAERFMNGFWTDAAVRTRVSKSLADAGRWDYACDAKERMTARRIRKTAACKWIEVYSISMLHFQT